MTCQNPEAFTHKPKTEGRGAIKQEFIHPVARKTRWEQIWTAAKSEAWYTEDFKFGLVFVGSDGYAYFQYRGLTTGFARVYVGAEQ